MTKKFFSIVLSLVLVIGLLPVINVSAADEIIYMEDDFQSYDVRVYSNADTPLKVDGVSKWTVNKSVKVEVVNMNDSNGNPTKALKYCNTRGRYQSIPSGQNDYRFTAIKTNSAAPALTALAGKVFVQEIDIWLPANVETADGLDRKRPGSFNFGGGIVVEGNELKIGGASTGKTIESEKWYNIKATFDFSQYTAKGEPVTCTAFINDKAVYHKTLTSVSPGASFGYFIMLASQQFSSHADAVGEFNDIYVIFDNLKMYVDPTATTASSGIAGSTSVSSKATPAVNFTNNILELSSHSDGIISAEKNIEFYKTEAPTSTVAISELNVSEDGKSLEIVPVKDLDKGTSYTVTIKNLKDMYGRGIDPYTFSFTTAEDYKLSATKPVFTKVDLVNANVESQEIDTLENGYINAAYTLNNTASTDAQAMMIAVLKDGDTIEYMQFDTVTVPANGTYTYNAGFKVDNYTTQKIEVFAWDSLYAMTPLVSKYGISESGITEVPNND